MRSRAPILRVGPLVVDWRITTRRLDAIGADENAGNRVDDDGIAIPERSTPAVAPDPAVTLLDERV
ncbi:MAG TPA: hypothetical protein VGH98_08515 [Gemmatimonadaceae bacterium]|jgi:hypothetical protein